ncbi:hypothetical protein I5Q34_16505 [Streptomyces sp. AV19]|uniref:hypothetical protein n=1 Tax=Streptomyces sp. AV19 TaxID=2793068 RepID=UPI0018FE3576|nr:hypothetical protein [Streptomyces sp. AV19]MBH1935849.1 hypothetical protein [Streptomyces sp. AV19]MDG4534367.1 hypothetical protein [Streptomyces sp. AV19]
MKFVRAPRRTSLCVAGAAAVAISAIGIGGTAFAAESHQQHPTKPSTQYVQTDSKGNVTYLDKAPANTGAPAQKGGSAAKSAGKYVQADSKGNVTYLDKAPAEAGVPAQKGGSATKSTAKYVQTDSKGKVTYLDKAPADAGVPAQESGSAR